MTDDLTQTLATSGGHLSSAEAEASGIQEGSYVTSSGVFTVEKRPWGYATLRTSSIGTSTPSPTVYSSPGQEIPTQDDQVAMQLRDTAKELQKSIPQDQQKFYGPVINVKQTKTGFTLEPSLSQDYRYVKTPDGPLIVNVETATLIQKGKATVVSSGVALKMGVITEEQAKAGGNYVVSTGKSVIKTPSDYTPEQTAEIQRQFKMVQEAEARGDAVISVSKAKQLNLISDEQADEMKSGGFVTVDKKTYTNVVVRKEAEKIWNKMSQAEKKKWLGVVALTWRGPQYIGANISELLESVGVIKGGERQPKDVAIDLIADRLKSGDPTITKVAGTGWKQLTQSIPGLITTSIVGGEVVGTVITKVAPKLVASSKVASALDKVNVIINKSPAVSSAVTRAVGIVKTHPTAVSTGILGTVESVKAVTTYAKLKKAGYSDERIVEEMGAMFTRDAIIIAGFSAGLKDAMTKPKMKTEFLEYLEREGEPRVMKTAVAKKDAQKLLDALKQRNIEAKISATRGDRVTISWRNPPGMDYLPVSEIKKALKSGTVLTDDAFQKVIQYKGTKYTFVKNPPPGALLTEGDEIVSVVRGTRNYFGQYQNFGVYVEKSVEVPIALTPASDLTDDAFKPFIKQATKTGYSYDPLKDVWFFKQPGAKSFYVVRGALLKDPNFWKGLPSNIKKFLDSMGQKGTFAPSLDLAIHQADEVVGNIDDLVGSIDDVVAGKPTILGVQQQVGMTAPSRKFIGGGSEVDKIVTDALRIQIAKKPTIKTETTPDLIGQVMNGAMTEIESSLLGTISTFDVGVGIDSVVDLSPIETPGQPAPVKRTRVLKEPRRPIISRKRSKRIAPIVGETYTDRLLRNVLNDQERNLDRISAETMKIVGQSGMIKRPETGRGDARIITPGIQIRERVRRKRIVASSPFPQFDKVLKELDTTLNREITTVLGVRQTYDVDQAVDLAFAQALAQVQLTDTAERPRTTRITRVTVPTKPDIGIPGVPPIFWPNLNMTLGGAFDSVDTAMRGIDNIMIDMEKLL